MSVTCDRCDGVWPGHCDRCAYLLRNMRRWRNVAEVVHARTCDGKHTPRDCSAWIETVYQELRQNEQRVDQ